MTRLTRWTRAAGAAVLCLGLAGLPAGAADTNQLLERGTKLYEKGQYDKALGVFLKVKNLDPSNAQAREYISRCTEKIVEKETGERLKRAVQRAEAPSATIEPGEAVPSWASPAGSRAASARRARGKALREKKGAAVPVFLEEKEKNTSSFIIKREQLAENYKNKTLESRPLIVERHGRQTEVVAFMNRLFLPFSDTLSPDAIPALEAAARTLREEDRPIVVLRAVDSLTPAIRHQMLDLPSRRAAVLFSYFMHASFGKSIGADQSTFTAADLDE